MHDTWTFTALGPPWIDQQWGAQVILAGVYQLAGWTGLVILRAALIGVIFGCLFVDRPAARPAARDARRWLTLAAFVIAAVALGAAAAAARDGAVRDRPARAGH